MEKTAEIVHADKLVEVTNILVGTDFSPASDRALDYALSLAQRYDARIILAHVITAGTDAMLAPEIAANTRETAFGAAQEEMGQVLISGKLRGVHHETVIEEGVLWPTLEALITRYKADLVVVGTHHLKGLKKMLLGSGAEQIFRQAKCPVLTVGPATEGGAPREGEFKRILFATDFGAGAEREAAFAFSLAQEHQANVTLLHVVSRVEDYSEPGLASKNEAVSHELAELIPAGSGLWCKPEIRMQVGEPVEEILRAAKDVKADLIVIGAKHKKGLAAGHTLHTVAYQLAGAAPCPVLTVRS
jgi:nucleotide-binding universal stress UspA family protein